MNYTQEDEDRCIDRAARYPETAAAHRAMSRDPAMKGSGIMLLFRDSGHAMGDPTMRLGLFLSYSRSR